MAAPLRSDTCQKDPDCVTRGTKGDTKFKKKLIGKSNECHYLFLRNWYCCNNDIYHGGWLEASREYWRAHKNDIKTHLDGDADRVRHLLHSCGLNQKKTEECQDDLECELGCTCDDKQCIADSSEPHRGCPRPVTLWSASAHETFWDVDSRREYDAHDDDYVAYKPQRSGSSLLIGGVVGASAVVIIVLIFCLG
eukprot:425189_1